MIEPFTERIEKIMKLSKLILGAATAAVVIGAGNFARAQDVANGTYTFTANDGYNYLNGSSVTFVGDVPKSWKLVDTDPADQYAPWMGPGPVGYVPPAALTPANSSLIGYTVYAPTQYGSSAFAFQVGSPVGAPSTHNSYFWFSADNDLFGPGDSGDLYKGFGYGPAVDPSGYWTNSASVPDASATLPLFVGALTALGTCKSFLRGRFASRR
jgi:hypothetical protein